MQSVAPSCFAMSNLEGLVSMAKIRLAPLILLPCKAAKPTAPRPKTATEEPASTLQVLKAAPSPVLWCHRLP